MLFDALVSYAVLLGVPLGTGRSIGARSALERVELLHAWSEGPLPERLSHDGIKVVLGMAYFNHPSVMEALGVSFRCSVSSP